MNPLVLIILISILLVVGASKVSQQIRSQPEPSNSNKTPKNVGSSKRKNVIPFDKEIKVHVAVIGGGTNAALFAHYLHELINAEVHIYNHGMIQKIENTSFIVHEKHKYMMKIISKLNLETKDLHPVNRAVVMYDGQQNLVLNFEKNNPIEPLMKSYIQPMFQKFDKIYDAQQKHFKSFLTPSNLLLSMSETFQKLLYISTQEYISQQYYWNFLNVKETIHSLLLINYAQNLQSNAFAGLTSLIFSQSTGKLKRIITPIDQVVRKLVNKSDQFFDLNVTKVTYEEILKKVFRLRVSWIGEDGKESSQLYNYIVLATPEIDNIDFFNFKKPIEVCKNRKMVFVTVTASLKEGIFENPSTVTTIANVKDSGSIRLASKISDLKWKILADDNDGVSNEISSIFNVTGNAEVEDIALWPDYSDEECALKTTFVLHTKMFYLNAIEWASGLLEMKAIGAKNVALRIKQSEDKFS